MSFGGGTFGAVVPGQAVTSASGGAAPSATATTAVAVATSASSTVSGGTSTSVTVGLTASGTVVAGVAGSSSRPVTVATTSTGQMQSTGGVSSALTLGTSASGAAGLTRAASITVVANEASSGSTGTTQSSVNAVGVATAASGTVGTAPVGGSTQVTATVGLPAGGVVLTSTAATDSAVNAPDISAHGTVLNGSGTWDNTAATTEGSEYSNAVWQKVYVASAGTTYFQHDVGPAGDTVMGIFRGAATITSFSDLTALAFADDTIGNKPAITYTSPGNEWIYIESSGYSGGRFTGQRVLFTLPQPSGQASMDITVTPTADFTRAALNTAASTTANGFVYDPPKVHADWTVATTATGTVVVSTVGSVRNLLVRTTADGMVLRDSLTRVNVALAADGVVGGHISAGWGICLGGIAETTVDNSGRVGNAMRFNITASGTVSVPAVPVTSGFTVVLDEQWATIDTSKWSVYNNNTFGAPQRVQRYMAYNAVTGNASPGATNNKSLKLLCKRENVGGNAFTAGMVDSKGTGTYYPRYGRFEFRAKIPHGQGIWPSFWLTAKNGGATMCEFDIVEYFHISTPGHNSTTLHGTDETETFHSSRYTNNGGANPRTPFESPSYTPGWHTWIAEIVPVTNATGSTLADPTLPSHYVRYRIYLDSATTPAVSFVDTSAMYYTTNGGDTNSFWNVYIQGSQIGGEYVGMPDDPLGYSTQHNGCVNGGTAPNACTVSYQGQVVRRAGASGATATFADPATTFEIDYVRISKFG